MTETPSVALSICFLVLAAGIPIAYLISRFFVRGSYSIPELLLYAPCYCLARLLWRTKIAAGSGFDLAAGQGAVIVANHRSSIDPFFVQLAAGRRVHWMVASEYCRHALFGPILRTLQVIPTNRGGIDTASTKLAIRYASQGRLIGMFPEGRINRTQDPLLSIRPGAALVAMRADVPLLACWIDGSPSAPSVWEPLFKAARVTVRFGKPTIPVVVPENDRSSSQAATREMIRSVMVDAARLGGHGHFSPTIAGRNWNDEPGHKPPNET